MKSPAYWVVGKIPLKHLKVKIALSQPQNPPYQPSTIHYEDAPHFRAGRLQSEITGQVTLYLFEKVALLSICSCPVAIRDEIQATEHGDVFFCSVLSTSPRIGPFQTGAPPHKP